MDDEKYLELVHEVENEFPGFSIKLKSNSWMMKAIDVFLKVITFWQMDVFMTKYFTTIGYTLYVSGAKWDLMSSTSKACLLRHERIHMRQRRKHGMLLFSFLYLFFPFPTLFAYWRMKFEWEAYSETLRAYHEYFGLQYVQNSQLRRDIINHFTSAEYIWMWPWRQGLEKRYDALVDTFKET